MSARRNHRPFVVLGLLAVLAAIGMAAPAEEAFRPAGRLFAVDGHGLHLHCTGTGKPTVVLEAGLGGNHLDWAKVQPQLSAVTRTCSYDRAGYGWSEPGPKPRTAEQITGELHTLLAGAGVRPPIVLVGHSFGGLVGLRYAARFPTEVAGLVLLDPMHPEQFERFHEIGVDLPTEPSRAVLHSGTAMMVQGIPAAQQALARRLAGSETARSFMFNELRNVLVSIEQVRAGGFPSGLPAAVVVHGNREWDAIYPDGRMEDAWLRMQGDLARQLGADGPIIAARSGHQIALDAPDLAIEVVTDVLRDLRNVTPTYSRNPPQRCARGAPACAKAPSERGDAAPHVRPPAAD